MRKYLIRLWLTLRHQMLERRYRRLVLEQIDDMRLVILPNVFNPVLFRTGEMLARAVQKALLLHLDEKPAPVVLDLGSGSGIGGIFAARQGARVLAIDLNPEAVRCSKINALLNGFEDKIEVQCGDLFEAVGDRQFDFVLFNPPFYCGQPRDNLDMAWRGEKIFERFAGELKDHLTSSGYALIVLSTDGENEFALDALKTNDFVVTEFLQRDFGNEVIVVYKVEYL
ncbi:MAG TPA: methyltransferase [Anaerolineales bacterium]|nr:methyltransferase [Anaerolineales bacterium]